MKKEQYPGSNISTKGKGRSFRVRYQVRLRRVVQKQLDKLAEKDDEVVVQAISALEQEPRPSRVKKLAESGLWRIRVGRYRVVYSINDEERLGIVVRVAGRAEDTYSRL